MTNFITDVGNKHRNKYIGVWPSSQGDSKTEENVIKAFLKKYNDIKNWDEELKKNIGVEFDREGLHCLINQSNYTDVLQLELNAFKASWEEEWKKNTGGSCRTSPIRIPGTEISKQITESVIKKFNDVEKALRKKTLSMSLYSKIVSGGVWNINPFLVNLNKKGDGLRVLGLLLNSNTVRTVATQVQKENRIKYH